MRNHTRTALVLVLLSLCTFALMVQSYQVYRLHQKVAELELATGLYPDDMNGFQNGSTLQPSFGFSPTIPPGLPDPFTNRRLMQNQMDSLFDSFFSAGSLQSRQWSGFTAGSPVIEVKESEEDYQIVIGTPENSDVELATNIEDNTVQISGSVSYDGANNSNRLSSSFTSRSEFSRSIPLAKPIDPLAMRTDKTNDAIVITVPKV